MELLVQSGLKPNIQIVSIESIYPDRISKYINNIDSIWKRIYAYPRFKNKRLHIISYDNYVYNQLLNLSHPDNTNTNNISNDNNINTSLMLAFSGLLHNYLTIFKQIEQDKLNNSAITYYILSGYSLTTFKEVFFKLSKNNTWMKGNTFTLFCRNLEYTISLFKPDKYIYDYHAIMIDQTNITNNNNTNTNTTTSPKTEIYNNIFKFLNTWMDSIKKSECILCLDGSIVINNDNNNNKASDNNDNNNIIAIIDFLLDN